MHLALSLINTAVFTDKRMRSDESGSDETATVQKPPRDVGPMLGLKSSSASNPAYDPTGKFMKDVWLWLMRPPNKGILPSTLNTTKQRKALINQVDSWYRSLALPSELVILKDPASDQGRCLLIVNNIDKLLAQRLQVCDRRPVQCTCMCDLHHPQLPHNSHIIDPTLHCRRRTRHQAMRSATSISTSG